MIELNRVIENGEIHYTVTKERNGKIVFFESFDYNEYNEAVSLYNNLNCS